MANTQHTEPSGNPRYQKAAAICASETPVRTDARTQYPRSIVTSHADAPIQVLIVNKPESDKTTDKSTR